MPMAIKRVRGDDTSSSYPLLSFFFLIIAIFFVLPLIQIRILSPIRKSLATCKPMYDTNWYHAYIAKWL